MPDLFGNLGDSEPYVPNYLQDEIQFRIDNDLRTIAIPADGVVLGVVGDKNVNHVNFQMPAWYNGFDMSEFQARINFVDPEGNANYYTVNDMTVYDPEGNEVTGTPGENDTLYFTWLVDSYATQYAGTVQFSVRLFKLDNSDGVSRLVQAFNTQINACNVLSTIQLAEYVSQEQMEDILYHYMNELGDVAEELKADIEAKAAATLETIPDDYTSLNNEITKIKSDLVQSIIKSTNLVNPDEIVNGLNNGTTIDTSQKSYWTSGYIDVRGHAGETLSFSKPNGTSITVHTVCAYNGSHEFVTRRGYWVGTVTIESNWTYVRVCAGLNKFKVEFGNVTPWQDYTGTTYVPVKITSKQVFDENIVPVTSCLYKAKNLTNPEEIVDGALNVSTGEVYTLSGYYTSGYIDVTGHINTKIYFTGGNAHAVVAYNESKQRIGSNGYWLSEFNIPTNAKYVRYSMYNSKKIMAEWDGHTVYHDYTSDTYINVTEVARSVFWGEIPKIKTGVHVVSPSKIRTVSGVRLALYYENIFYNFSRSYAIATQLSNVGKTIFDDCFLLNNESTSKTQDGIFYSESYNPYIQSNTNKQCQFINIPNQSTGITKKILFIGDSMTDGNVYTQKLLDMFEEETDSIELLGTRGTTTTNRHEGRSGWRAYTYTHFQHPTSADNEGISVDNPFWNPDTNKFDFSYYMQANNYSSVDYVFLCMGTNDQARGNHKTNEEMIDAWDEMIDSIKQFNANVKIGIWLAPTRSQLADSYRTQMNKALDTTEVLISTYDNKESENIYLVPVYINVNPMKDYGTSTVTVDGIEFEYCTDITHPSEQGYLHIARVVYGYIKHMMYNN